MSDLEKIQEGKFFAAIAYVPFLCLVPLIFKKSNSFAVFHGKQGLIIFVFEVGATVIGIIPIFGQLVSTIVFLFCFVFSVIGFIQATLGIYWRLPWTLGKWVEQIEV